MSIKYECLHDDPEYMTISYHNECYALGTPLDLNRVIHVSITCNSNKNTKIYNTAHYTEKKNTANTAVRHSGQHLLNRGFTVSGSTEHYFP